MIARLILLTLMSIPTIVYAGCNCSFTSECISGEACAETTFSLSFETADCTHDQLAITASTDVGDLAGMSLSTCSEANAFALSGAGTSYLLTLHDSAAQLTTHMDGPMAITYTGTCEAKN